jgi:hypothetical protein
MTINVTLAFPEAIIEKIDRNRGDVNRSRFVLRLIEFAYEKKQNKKLQHLATRVGSSQVQTAEVLNAQTAAESDFSNDR